METFLIALAAVGALLFAAVPGYLFIKTKLVDKGVIPVISKLLVYISQPAIAIYTFAGLKFSWKTLLDMGAFMLLTLVFHIVVLGLAYLILRRKSEKAVYRIITIAMIFSNSTFFGIPIIEALLPEISKGLLAYASIYSLATNLVGWTVGAAIITHNTKYITVKKIFINPAFLGTFAAFIIFVFSIPVQSDIMNMITLMGKMATPLSMIGLGMRIATVDLRSVFCDARLYLSSAVKQIVMPLIAFAIIWFLPIDAGIKCVFYILNACPTAAVVLNYSEILGEGQNESSCALLLSTITSIASLPLMMLLLNLII